MIVLEHKKSVVICETRKVSRNVLMKSNIPSSDPCNNFFLVDRIEHLKCDSKLLQICHSPTHFVPLCVDCRRCHHVVRRAGSRVTFRRNQFRISFPENSNFQCRSTVSVRRANDLAWGATTAAANFTLICLSTGNFCCLTLHPK